MNNASTRIQSDLAADIRSLVAQEGGRESISKVIDGLRHSSRAAHLPESGRKWSLGRGTIVCTSAASIIELATEHGLTLEENARGQRFLVLDEDPHCEECDEEGYWPLCPSCLMDEVQCHNANELEHLRREYEKGVDEWRFWCDKASTALYDIIQNTARGLDVTASHHEEHLSFELKAMTAIENGAGLLEMRGIDGPILIDIETNPQTGFFDAKLRSSNMVLCSARVAIKARHGAAAAIAADENLWR